MERGPTNEEGRFIMSPLVANHKNISDSETRKTVSERSWEYHRIMKVKLKNKTWGTNGNTIFQNTVLPQSF